MKTNEIFTQDQVLEAIEIADEQSEYRHQYSENQAIAYLIQEASEILVNLYDEDDYEDFYAAVEEATEKVTEQVS